jgi:hypothetical protein
LHPDNTLVINPSGGDDLCPELRVTSMGLLSASIVAIMLVKNEFFLIVPSLALV